MTLPGPRVLGLAAALATVIIWAAFMLVTRFAVQGSFTVEELLILRLVPGALVMAPVMWRLGVMPRGQSWPRAAMLMVGASAVFPFVVSKGLAYAPPRMVERWPLGCCHFGLRWLPMPWPEKSPARAAGLGWR
jgi:drug/metabolite transporter (DMT)-like permease